MDRATNEFPLKQKEILASEGARKGMKARDAFDKFGIM
jgi:hypothetical protein